MPALLVLVVQVVPRSTSVAVTVTLGSAEPEGSVTVPVIEPAACCAHAGEGTVNVTIQKQAVLIATDKRRSFSFTEVSLISIQFALLCAWSSHCCDGRSPAWESGGRRGCVREA